MYDLPFDDYLQARYERAVASNFFFWFPEPDALVFAQALWAKQYWFAKNGGERV